MNILPTWPVAETTQHTPLQHAQVTESEILFKSTN